MIIKKIELPLSSFQNILNKYSEKLYKLFKLKKEEENNIIFLNKSILCFGLIEIGIDENKTFYFKFMRKFYFEDMKLVNHLFDEDTISELKYIVRSYIFTLTNLSESFNYDVSINYVNSVYEKIQKQSTNTDDYFLIPTENNFFIKNDLLINKSFNFSYFLKITKYDRGKIYYSIIECISSLLDNTKNINNIRYDEINTIYSSSFKRIDTEEFLKNLFFHYKIIS